MRHSRPLATTGTRIHGQPRWLLLGLACVAGLSAGAGEPAAEPPARPLLHLTGGGFVAGQFVDTDKPGMIRWQGRSFNRPFDFDIKAIDGVQVPTPGAAQPPRPEGDFRFELSGGDVVYGTLVKLDAQQADLDLPRIGPLRVKRAHLLRIERWRDRADLVYLGPTGLADWRPTPHDQPNAWHEEAGQLLTDQEGVALFRDIALPAQAAFDLELSWKGKPDFMLALGVGDDEKSVASAFRFEVWGDDLVVMREAREADLASVAKVGDGSGRVHLKVFLDQERGRIIVDSPDGKPLADLTVAEATPRVLTGVRLENKKGDVRLERLEVAHWNGELLREALPDGPTLRRKDGSSLPAKEVRYDADSKSFVVSAGDGAEESTIPWAEVDRVTFSPLTDVPARPVNILLQDSSRLSGDLLKVENAALVLAMPGAEEPVRLPVDRLRSLVAHHGGDKPGETPGSLPRLEMEGVRLAGRLVDGPTEGAGATCLTWQPTGSTTASSLAAEASGRIVYKEPPPPPPKGVTRLSNGVQVFNGGGRLLAGAAVVRAQPAPPQGGLQGFLMGFARGAQRPSTAASPTTAASLGHRSLYLRTGDVIPAEVTKIDEKGLTIQTDMSKKSFVPHEAIKAAELSREPIVPVAINKAKRERLLTLPRMQKGSPPTHLIRSKDGDYLRGRVVEMDEQTVKVEVRLEVMTIPRDRVARIIWLHAGDTTEASKDPQAPARPVGPLQVQAVRQDGVRLTFVPARFEEGTLSGTSDVLGDCRVRLDEVDELLIGKTIEKEASQLAFQRWLLTDAPEPTVTEDEGGGTPGGGASGLSSPLVGKPAPDFSLDQLGGEGKTFRLAEAKGKVVVLDFWATWCGPCLQAMPQVEKVTGEFRDQGVLLIAVNLQEAPKDITAMLERHKLNLTVALDKDGAVAEKYKANAIPQTVIIDREGNVARLFVGGGPHLGDQLREALQATLDGPDAKKAKAIGEPGDDAKVPAQ